MFLNGHLFIRMQELTHSHVSTRPHVPVVINNDIL